MVPLVGEKFPGSWFFAAEVIFSVVNLCGRQQNDSVDSHRLGTFSWKRTWFCIWFPCRKIKKKGFLNWCVFQVGAQQVKVAEIPSMTLVIVCEWQWNILYKGSWRQHKSGLGGCEAVGRTGTKSRVVLRRGGKTQGEAHRLLVLIVVRTILGTIVQPTEFQRHRTFLPTIFLTTSELPIEQQEKQCSHSL